MPMGHIASTTCGPSDHYRVCLSVPDGYSSSTGSGAGQPAGPRDVPGVVRSGDDPYAPDPNNYVDDDDNGRRETIDGVDLVCSGYVSVNAEHPSNMRVDIGLRHGAGSIGNLVWNDANNNGLREADEVGVAGAIVTLYQHCSATDCPYGNPTPYRVSTDANGHYAFDGLPASSSYRVCLTLPAGYVGSTGSGVGNPPGPRDLPGSVRTEPDPYAPDPNNYVDDDDNGRTEIVVADAVSFGTFNCSGYVTSSQDHPSNQRVDFGIRSGS